MDENQSQDGLSDFDDIPVTANDLYNQLLLRGKLVVEVADEAEFFTLRTMLYRARKRQQEAFASIGGMDSGDGLSLVIRFDAKTGQVTLELKEKKQRLWRIVG